MAIDLKYGVVLDQGAKLGTDEPVFVIRARDIVAEHAIYSYADLALIAGASDGFVTSARNAAAAMARWQSRHHSQVKVPD